MKMKAAVCNEFGKPLVIEDIEIEPPAEGQVKVRLAATAICHSDIHAIRGELFGKTPLLAGHESSGYIEEVGEKVTSLSPGDPVVVSLIASCGHCLYCATGFPHLCETDFPLATHSPLRNKRGQSLENMVSVASFAEYAIVDQSQVVKIPRGMPMDRAALLGCGVITGFGSVVNRAQVKPLHSVVVIVAGGVGLNSIQGAALSGARPLIAVDVVDLKLEAALTFGASHVVNAKKVDPVAEVKKLTAGRGAEYVFVTVGNIAAMQQGLAMTGRRGTTVLVGLPPAKDFLPVSPFELIRTERILTGSCMGSTNLQVDIPALIDLYQKGKLKLDELITDRYSLGEINEAIEAVEKGKALRNIIVFN
jgi:S-(hydroxymethyl)glutathione dehydrogenase/alcohol dehydrogenase